MSCRTLQKSRSIPAGWDDLGVSINRAERPNIAILRIIVYPQMPLFFADESPHLIELQIAAGQIAHLGIQQSSASLPHAHAKPHDRIAVNARHALNRANAGTFGQCSDDRDLLVCAEDVCHASYCITIR